MDEATMEALAAIAREHLGFKSLETQNLDRLDFKEVAVWNAAKALEAAFELGRQSK